MKIIETLHDGKSRLISLTIMDDDKKIIRCKPVRRGKWEKVSPYIGVDGYREYDYECSNCKEVSIEATPYCPHCGAKMESEV